MPHSLLAVVTSTCLRPVSPCLPACPAGVAWYIAAADVLNEQFKRVRTGVVAQLLCAACVCKEAVMQGAVPSLSDPAGNKDAQPEVRQPLFCQAMHLVLFPTCHCAWLQRPLCAPLCRRRCCPSASGMWAAPWPGASSTSWPRQATAALTVKAWLECQGSGAAG